MADFNKQSTSIIWFQTRESRIRKVEYAIAVYCYDSH